MSAQSSLGNTSRATISTSTSQTGTSLTSMATSMVQGTPSVSFMSMFPSAPSSQGSSPSGSQAPSGSAASFESGVIPSSTTMKPGTSTIEGLPPTVSSGNTFSSHSVTTDVGGPSQLSASASETGPPMTASQPERSGGPSGSMPANRTPTSRSADADARRLRWRRIGGPIAQLGNYLPLGGACTTLESVARTACCSGPVTPRWREEHPGRRGVPCAPRKSTIGCCTNLLGPPAVSSSYFLNA
ncbi:hypothetical protein B0H14DRAFT_2565178 [Mycena olivaceomarginata]|nr:hypothetical protein B0H14DRAFT_2565178 [Mycena olivaceomarginata]